VSLLVFFVWIFVPAGAKIRAAKRFIHTAAYCSTGSDLRTFSESLFPPKQQHLLIEGKFLLKLACVSGV